MRVCIIYKHCDYYDVIYTHGEKGVVVFISSLSKRPLTVSEYRIYASSKIRVYYYHHYYYTASDYTAVCADGIDKMSDNTIYIYAYIISYTDRSKKLGIEVKPVCKGNFKKGAL